MTPTTAQLIEELLLAWHLLGIRAQWVQSMEITLPDGTTVVLR